MKKVFIKEKRIYSVTDSVDAEKSKRYWMKVYPDMEIKDLDAIFPEDCTKRFDKIMYFLEHLVVQNELYDYTDKTFTVEVTGDWKHDHLTLEHMLEEAFGIRLIQKVVTQDTGCDWFTAVHKYTIEEEK